MVNHVKKTVPDANQAATILNKTVVAAEENKAEQQQCAFLRRRAAPVRRGYPSPKMRRFYFTYLPRRLNARRCVEMSLQRKKTTTVIKKNNKKGH